MLFLLTALIAAALVAGCSAPQPAAVAGSRVVSVLSAQADAGFARAYAPMPFRFPQDHGAHPDYQTEWWYYTGNLADASGREFGYQLTFFRRGLTADMPARASSLATNQVYMAHLALTDVEANRHVALERFSRGDGSLAGAEGDPSASVWLEDWAVRQTEPGVYRLTAGATTGDGEPIALNLTLRETRPPVLHGENGLSRKGPEPGNANYYYSLTGLQTTGTLTRGDFSADVTGLSWMDHEFGTSALSGNALGWDWFSLQLDDGSALMLAQLRTQDGGADPSFEGTWLPAGGEQTVVRADDFTLEALDEWISPATGIAYPSGWRVTLPQQALSLTVTPLVRDQEMDTTYVYWEGAVRAEGEREGTPIAGKGYVELTGYGDAGAGSLR